MLSFGVYVFQAIGCCRCNRGDTPSKKGYGFQTLDCLRHTCVDISDFKEYAFQVLDRHRLCGSNFYNLLYVNSL